MTPLAPMLISGSVSESSPLRTVMSHSDMISLAMSSEPVASLIATMFGCWLQPGHGLRRHRDAGAAGDVVQHDRQIDPVGQRHEVPVQPFLRRLVVVRVDRQAGRCPGLLGDLRAAPAASLVALAPTPAMTGTRPLAVLHGQLDDPGVLLEIDRRDSPVVPTGTSPSMPAVDLVLHLLAQPRLVELAA